MKKKKMYGVWFKHKCCGRIITTFSGLIHDNKLDCLSCIMKLGPNFADSYAIVEFEIPDFDSEELKYISYGNVALRWEDVVKKLKEQSPEE